MVIATELLPIGLVAVAARTWRHRGRQLLTAIVKATYRIHHDGVMTPMEPSPIVTEERHFRGSPVASLDRASDLALLVPKPEVVILGSAFAGGGQRAPSTTVRFAVQRDDKMLISKRLDVVGDRRAPPGAPLPAPAPFDRIPIRYERALGGIMSRENPVGMGMGPDGDGLVSYPNIVLPSSGGVSPAGFGPIPSAWPIRQQHRGSMPWAAANTHLDVDVPDDFSDQYFQTAPSDQRTTELVGGELIAIVNMHPEIGTLRSYMPKFRGVALAQTERGERMPISLRIDTVHLEPDVMRAEIVYRGSLPLERGYAGRLWLAGALEAPGERTEFPDLSLQRGSFGRSPRAQSGPDFGGGTMVLEAGEPADPRPRHAAVPAPAPQAPPRAGTMIIEAGPVAPPRAAATALPDNPLGTMLPDEDAAPPRSLPFLKRQRRPSGQRAAVKTGAGTPWGAVPAPVRPAGDKFSSTMIVDEPTAQPETLPIAPKSAPAAPPPPAPPPPAPPPPAAPPPQAQPVENKNPWREDPPVAPAPREAPKPVVMPRADFKAGVYKKFKR